MVERRRPTDAASRRTPDCPPSSGWRLRYWGRGADLLIFEDLSPALDVATERQLWESLGRSKDATCLVASHRRPALRRATKILLLSEGRLIAEGRLEELLRTQAEMRRLWDAEAEEE